MYRWASLRSSLLPARSLYRFFSGNTKERIRFIGLGAMGAHQANNLIKKGYEVVVFDINKASVEKLVSQGASSASSPKHVASQVDVLITMLPSSDNVSSVYLGEQGIMEGVRKNALLADSSTIDPLVSRQVASRLAQKHASFIDCPVSGGTLGAEAGTLTFMVGASKDQFERAKPYLQAMGKNIVHCGEVGSGQVVKLCNNLILGVTMLGVAEAMNLGVKLGVDKKVLANVINTSSGRSWSSDTYNPCPGTLDNPSVPSNRNFAAGFQTALIKKDLGLAAQAAQAQKIPLPIGELAQQTYEYLSRKSGSLDFSSYYQLLQDEEEPRLLKRLLRTPPS